MESYCIRHILCVCHVCSYMYMYICMVCKHMWRSLSKFFRCYPPCLLAQGLSLVWIAPSRVGWLVSKPQMSACFCPPNTGIKNMCLHTQYFTWVLGIKLGSSCLFSKHSTSCVTSPDPIRSILDSEPLSHWGSGAPHLALDICGTTVKAIKSP